MKKYILISSILFTLLLIFFFLTQLLHIPFLADDRYGKLAATHLGWIGILLLVIDVLLPVPSSLVMITLGSTFGITKGALLAFSGIMGSAILGYYLGYAVQPFVDRFICDRERRSTIMFLDHWGMAGIIITRPFPLLAETAVLIAGTAGLSWKKLLIASFIGNLPVSFLYAWAGATAKNFDAGIWSFLFAIGIAAVFWAINYFLVPEANPTKKI